MKFIGLLIFSLFLISGIHSQDTGDTIHVQAFSFDNTSRDRVVSFPSDENITYEKIFLKYTMRCKEGLVSTSANPNLGCGQWDFSCNTYLVDSSKVETQLSSVESHSITNFEGQVFPYRETPVYNYIRETQSDVQITSASNELEATLGSESEELSEALSTGNLAGKSHYLYNAEELLAAGLTAGPIDALSLKSLEEAGEANYLKIRVKHSDHTDLESAIDFDSFTEVYNRSTNLIENQVNRFNFHTPFEWDGMSNIIVEFSFSNIVNTSFANTNIEGSNVDKYMGRTATNESEILLTNNTYIECNNYKGIGGSQNRTIEAWIKTNDGSNGEIVSWGTIITGRKWVFRLANGLLRLEVHGGGTVSSSRVDDGEWHHVACVLDGDNLSDISFYIDGVLDPNSTVGNTAINTNNTESPNVRISRGVNNRYLDAIVDDVRIWDTNLTEEIINKWKNFKVDSNHPNYDNLQLYYQFNDDENQVEDNSINGRDASIIGQRYSISNKNGLSLFKDFELTTLRPNITFSKGDYIKDVTTTQVDRPIDKEPYHFVITRTIEVGDPAFAKDDVVSISQPIQYWTPEELIFDELSGDLLEQNTLAADGEISISELEYYRRFPFYNELVSFVTPYGIGLDFGLEGESWYIDMTDYVTLLKGNKRLIMTLGGQSQEQMNLEFLFVVGTPSRDVIQFEQLWQGTNRIGNATIASILNQTKFAPISMPLSPDVEHFKLRSSITGHGSEGEFNQNGGSVIHKISLDQEDVFIWDITQECSENPIFPQGGTWIYDRQGWCPGEQTLITEHNLAPHVIAGNSVEIDYSTSNPQVPSGDYRYHVSHQLIGYGPANFQLDASVINIISPNNTAKYKRVGTICANPSIVIRNTGSSDLTSLTINYWLNDSQSPQSYEWSGNLGFMEEESVSIPSPKELWYDILSENNTFHVTISNPNQGQDEYTFNNEMSISIDIPEILPSNLTIEFRTNNVPNENKYQIVDGSGNVVGSNNLPTANTTYSDKYDLIDECYKLIVNDTGGDGVQWWANAAQGTGAIRLKDGDGNIIKTFEPDFGGRFEYSFTTDFAVSNEELDFLTSINVFPNPSSNYFTLEANDLSNANIYMTDMLGNIVLTNIPTPADKKVTINTQSLTSGIYFVVINKDDIITTRKVIVRN